MEQKTKSKSYLLVILTIHLLLYLSVGLNIPIVRQLIGFIYLTFIPGYVCLGILRIRRTNAVSSILFSVGLSIAFLMFLGFFASILGPFLGISQPLSLTPLIIMVSGATLVLFILDCRREIMKTFNLFPSEELARELLNFRNISRAVLIILLPVLSALATVFAKGSISLIILIVAVVFVLSLVSARVVPAKFYPLVIFAISLAMVLQFTLISPHIMGSDAPVEYGVYKLTESKGIWQPLSSGASVETYYTAMLSITILPTIYSVILGMNGEMLFKLFFPFIFSLVPVILYRICTSQGWKSNHALLASLFLVSSPLVLYGVDPLSLNRQIIGSLFLLLSIFTLAEGENQPRNRRLLLVVLGAALAVSHYSLMFIYITILIFVFGISKFKRKSKTVLNGAIVLLLTCFTLLYYELFSAPIVSDLVASFQNIANNFLKDFSNPAARSSSYFVSPQVQTIASPINWGLFASAHLLLVLGILAVMFKSKIAGFNFEYRIIVLVSSLFLFLGVAIPNFAPLLNFSRFYGIALLLLAPCFVIGGKTFFLLIERFTRSKRRTIARAIHRLLNTKIPLLMIVILTSSYFLSQSGLINYVTGGSMLSTTLSWNELKTANLSTSVDVYNFYTLYIPDQDILSAKWLSKVMVNNSLIYSDGFSGRPLDIYGSISQDHLAILANYTVVESNSYIYLRSYNTISGLMIPLYSEPFNVSSISPSLSENSKIYTNGRSEIFSVHR